MSLSYNGKQFLFLDEGVALWPVTRYTARTVPIPTRPATQQWYHHSKRDTGAALAVGCLPWSALWTLKPLTIQNYQRDALNIIYSSNIITLLYMYNCVLLKMSTWYSKHVEESNNIWRINNIQCITLLVLYGQFMMHGQRNIKLQNYAYLTAVFSTYKSTLLPWCLTSTNIYMSGILCKPVCTI